MCPNPKASPFFLFLESLLFLSDIQLEKYTSWEFRYNIYKLFTDNSKLFMSNVATLIEVTNQLNTTKWGVFDPIAKIISVWETILKTKLIEIKT